MICSKLSLRLQRQGDVGSHQHYDGEKSQTGWAARVAPIDGTRDSRVPGRKRRGLQYQGFSFEFVARCIVGGTGL